MAVAKAVARNVDVDVRGVAQPDSGLRDWARCLEGEEWLVGGV